MVRGDVSVIECNISVCLPHIAGFDFITSTDRALGLTETAKETHEHLYSN